MKAFTDVRFTSTVTGRFEALRWHMTTSFDFFFANGAFPATAIETANPATNSASRTALSFKRFTPSECGLQIRKLRLGCPCPARGDL
jgi:hypothetical protein